MAGSRWRDGQGKAEAQLQRQCLADVPGIAHIGDHGRKLGRVGHNRDAPDQTHGDQKPDWSAVDKAGQECASARQRHRQPGCLRASPTVTQDAAEHTAERASSDHDKR
jgi:hypothetical protein